MILKHIPKQAETYLLDRLAFIKVEPESILTYPEELSTQLQSLFPNATVNNTEQQNYDLIIHHLLLEPKQLEQYATLLNPKGLLLFTSLGPDTGKEINVEADFLDMHILGDQLQSLGFSLPVMDRDPIELVYKNPESLARDFGEQARQACEAHKTDDGFYPISYELIYGHAWGVQEKSTEANFPLSQLRRITEL